MNILKGIEAQNKAKSKDVFGPGNSTVFVVEGKALLDEGFIDVLGTITCHECRVKNDFSLLVFGNSISSYDVCCNGCGSIISLTCETRSSEQVDSLFVFANAFSYSKGTNHLYPYEMIFSSFLKNI